MKHSFIANLILLAAFLVWAAQTHAQTTAELGQTAATPRPSPSSAPKYELQITNSAEKLSRNSDWRQMSAITLERKISERVRVWGSYRNYRRRAGTDSQTAVGAFVRLNKKTAVTVETAYSPTARFVSRVFVAGEVERVFKKGWVAHAGARVTAYSAVTTAIFSGTAEKYWGNNRATYTLYLAKTPGIKSAPTHRVQYDRYYGERVNTVGVSFAFGREFEYFGAREGIIKSNVVSGTVSLKHWVTDKFAVNANATLHRQGDLYYRKGSTVGVSYRF